ncbi:MAG TPA: hypothetical protein VMS88_03505, partial [Terriglobales bacterium]|nr:hypothetical protein [Terriglobales bacterium]
HARWVIRSEPLFEAEVLSWQRLNLPGIGSLQGCWIQYTSEVYGPQDAVYVWYGPDGYLGLSARLEVVTPSHTWILWYSERLEGMDLVGRNHP